MSANSSSVLDPGRIPETISGVGVVLLLVFVLEWTAFSRMPAVLGSESFLVSFVLGVSFAGAVLYGGYWLGRSDVGVERYPRVGKWFVGGTALSLGVNVLLMVPTPWLSLPFFLGWVRFAASVGGSVGLLVGVVEARAIQRALDAQRAAVRAEEAEQRHQYLDYLNSLLRHEVLNSANVVTGYTSLLLEDERLDETTRDRLETVHRHGADMTNVIRDVQVLLAASRDADGLEPTDLSTVLRTELDDLRAVFESVDVEASIPDGTFVRADDLLPRVFANLFANAVEHNDAETPRVDVTVETDSETVTVYVADDGPGVPEDERATLFERGDNTGANHGLGLYLVQMLVDRYDGEVELAETGPDGSVFAVELPAADEPAAPRPAVPESERASPRPTAESD